MQAVSHWQPHIVALDDDPAVRELLTEYLSENDLRVTALASGSELDATLARDPTDLLVLDLRLAGEDGMQIARRLRDTSSLPILMLTGRSEEADRVMGLELGADDYLTKPFSPRELVARVRAVLRRGENATVESEVVRAADVTLDVPRRKTRVGTRSVELTSSEFQLLATLMRQPGRVFTRSQLLDTIRGEEGDSFERAVDAHVKNLRRKIERDPRKPKYLQTVYGVGYRFTDA